MAAPSYTEDLTDITEAESTTNWSESTDANWDDGGNANADADYAAWRNPVRPRIDVAIDQSSISNGALKTRAALERVAGERNAAVDFGRVHGYGMQWVHPTVQITFPDGATVLYGPVRESDASSFTEAMTRLWDVGV